MGAKLAAVVGEIQSYPLTFKQVPKLKVATTLDLPCEEDGASLEGVPIKPSKTSKMVRSYPGTPLTIFVDGGMAEDMGVIGFVVFSPGGNEVVRVGKCN